MNYNALIIIITIVILVNLLEKSRDCYFKKIEIPKYSIEFKNF